MALKVGILGAGYIGGVYARNLRRDDRVQLVGIADILLEPARRLAAEIGTRALPDLPALLQEGAQAVYVATPNAHHVEPVIGALGHEVHVSVRSRWPRSWTGPDRSPRRRRTATLAINWGSTGAGPPPMHTCAS